MGSHLSRFSALLFAFLFSGLCAAETYPSKPIKWIVPFPPGGPTDTFSRAAAQKLSTLMGQSRPLRSVHRAEGWTPEAIGEQAIPALRAHFYGLDRSQDVFSWDPI